MYDPKKTEQEVLKFWLKKRIYEKAKKKNVKGKPFYFLQGPPYTSGALHIGHAWNNTLKDIFLRYKRMRGYNVWDRAGYDMHGLPTENRVQKNLGLKYKEDIKKFRVSKFVKECEKFVTKIAKEMSADLWKLGVWMDYKNAYMPIENDFIEGVWLLIKEAAQQKRLYKDKKVLHWCASCETSLARHELEYEKLKENSYFVKFPIIGKEKEFLIIWTTTPWTIPFNLAVMANPSLEYAKVAVDNEKWILASSLLEQFFSLLDKKYKVEEKFYGKELLGISYKHPFYEELKIEDCKVVLSEKYVSGEEGSGLVHCAPGCGPEDFEVGKEYNIEAFNTLDEKGIFQNLNMLTGLVAKKDDEKIVEILKQKKYLVAEKEIIHEYPICWRCGNPVIFRATEQWFLKIADLREKMLEENKKVVWIPQFGKKIFEDWISGLQDNSITRQRFFGTPAPIWECSSCGRIKIIGSIEELKKNSKKIPRDLHKPFIDTVEIRCECGKSMKRIEDILDVWLDSGSASWNCLYWPKRKYLLKELFPADFILEATEQIKLWFSMLLICSMIVFRKSCYKAVYMHGMILDYMGRKMSKSLGNIISPYEVIDKVGADVLRCYMCATRAGENINFDWGEVNTKRKNLEILWNIHKFLLGLPRKKTKKKYEEEEKYILSRLYSVMEDVTNLLENYRIDETIPKIEKLFLELSRDYIHFVREKAEKNPGLVASVVDHVLTEILKMYSIICPFITEAIWQNLKKKEESIHLCSWPIVKKKFINKKLESYFEITKKIIEIGLGERAKAGIGIRWPLKKAIIFTKNPDAILKRIVKTQLNVKKVEVRKAKEEKVLLEKKLTKELIVEGYTRELTRKIQDARKKCGMKKNQKIKLLLKCDNELKKYVLKKEKMIKEKINAHEIIFVEEIEKAFEEKIKEKKVAFALELIDKRKI